MKYLIAVFLIAILVAGSTARHERCLKRLDLGNCRPARREDAWTWNRRHSRCEKVRVCDISGNAFRTRERCRKLCR